MHNFSSDRAKQNFFLNSRLHLRSSSNNLLNPIKIFKVRKLTSSLNIEHHRRDSCRRRGYECHLSRIHFHSSCGNNLCRLWLRALVYEASSGGERTRALKIRTPLGSHHRNHISRIFCINTCVSSLSLRS